MKTKTIRGITLVLASVAILSLMMLPAVSAKPATFTVNYNQAQFQWRGIAPFGAWSYSYQNSPATSDYKLSGEVLHSAWDYNPPVVDVEGASTVYVYDKKSELWIEKAGKVSYVYEYGYGPDPVVNFFYGYLDFGGNEPSDANFVHGVAYQWIYQYLPETATLTGAYTVNAKWDPRVGAWLVGFSIYLWDKTSQGYTTAFPDPFIEPLPANNYNPLDL